MLNYTKSFIKRQHYLLYSYHHTDNIITIRNFKKKFKIFPTTFVVFYMENLSFYEFLHVLPSTNQSYSKDTLYNN